MKRSADTSAASAHNADTRKQKLETDGSGHLRLPVDRKRESAEDKAKASVADLLEGLAATLENNQNGQGQELWNSAVIGRSLQHVIKAREARIDKYPIGDDINVAAERPVVVVANLSAAAVKSALTEGIVDELQNPMFDVGPDCFPVLQIYGMRIDVGSSLAAHGRPFNTTSLTLLDGSGKLVVARVAMTINEKARRLQQGHLIKLTKFHRWNVAPYDDRYSTAGVGLVDFDVVGMGQLFQVDGGPTAASRSETAGLVKEVAEKASDSSAPAREDDVFENWDESKERPPAPSACCTAANRQCSMYGTHFFRKCVCDVVPIPSEDGLKNISDIYYATTMPVDEMTNNLKRNVLYWFYATEVYNTRGWLHREPLPSCLVFRIRFLYPNDKGDGYVGFIDGHQEEEEEEE